MQLSFGHAIASISTNRSILSSTAFRIHRSTCLRRQLNPHTFPSPVSFRRQSDRADNRPPPPELDLKSQDSEAMNELQKEQEIKKKQENIGGKPAKPDILEEQELSKAEQRKVNWGILKTLVKYIWPKVRGSPSNGLR